MGDRTNISLRKELERFSMLRTVNISPLRGERVTPAPLITLSRACGVFRLLPSASAATWTRQPSGTMAWLRAVYFLDQNRGWVAGSSGTLLKTIDGGQTWRKLYPLTKDNLRDVYFANERIGWLVAERDVLKLETNDEPRTYLLKTEDGGFTWRPVLLNGFDINARLVRAVFT